MEKHALDGVHLFNIENTPLNTHQHPCFQYQVNPRNVMSKLSIVIFSEKDHVYTVHCLVHAKNVSLTTADVILR